MGRSIRRMILLVGGLVVWCSASFGQTPEIQKGLDYLAAAQKPDGSFGDENTLVGMVPATNTVIEALNELGVTGSTGYTNAVTWLASQSLDTTEELAQRIWVLNNPGADIDLLLSYSYYGSNFAAWGGQKFYANNILDTALSLKALCKARYNSLSAYYIMNYFKAEQNADGGWGFSEGDESQVFITAAVVQAMALCNHYPFEETFQKGNQYLLTHQNTDGGFGQGASTVYETALAFLALVEGNTILYAPALQARSYLFSNQLANGSWNNDVYETALAIMALDGIQPDLTLGPKNITFSNALPLAGEAITVTASISNVGLSAASNIMVRFYEGDPALGGIQIGSDQIIATIDAKNAATVSISHAFGGNGSRKIYVQIDPLETIAETNEANNTAFSNIWVATRPDPAIFGEDLKVLTAKPEPNVPFVLGYCIRNLGETAVGAFKVALYDGDPNNGGVLLQSWDISGIAGAAVRNGTIGVTLANSGTHHLWLVLDPDNLIEEISENNNRASVAIGILAPQTTGPDLVIGPVDISLTPARPALGEMVTLKAEFHNYGTEAAQNFKVELFDGAPETGGTLIAEQVYTLNAGQSNSLSTQWVMPAGIHTIYAVLDRGNSVSEVDELNNRALAKIMADMVDVVVSSDDLVFLPEHPVTGDAVALSIIAHNPGIRETGPFTLNLYDGPPQAGGNLLNSFNIDTVTAEGSKTVIFNFTAQAGVYQFHAVADSADQVAELNENNNSASRSLIVKDQGQTYGPDLAMLKIDLKNMTTDPQTLATGGTVSVTFQNKGDEKIETPFMVKIFEDLNRDGKFTAGVDIQVGEAQNTQALQPNGAFGLNIPMQGSVAFLHAPLTAIIDAGDAILEQNEDNNLIQSGWDCESKPINPIEPVLKWKWQQPVMPYPYIGIVQSPPAIINLNDDNGDGKVDEKDIPDLVFTNFHDNYSIYAGQNRYGKIWAFDGATGNVLFTIDDAVHRPTSGGNLAAGDIDGDGFPEIITGGEQYSGRSSALLCYDHNGNLKWDNGSMIDAWNQNHVPWYKAQIHANIIPVLHDFDGDGKAEIVTGGNSIVITNADGSIRCVADVQQGGKGIADGFIGSVAVADLDMDGSAEIVTATSAYDSNCNLKWWNQKEPSGFIGTEGVIAIGNLDDDPYPEIARVHRLWTGSTNEYALSILEHDGTPKWGPLFIGRLEGVINVGMGSHPMIADFDGDGKAEIGVRGKNKYHVIDQNGQEKISYSVPFGNSYYDIASLPTVFDLDGDGIPEAIFRSDNYFRIFNGKTGNLLYEELFGTAGGTNYCALNYQSAFVVDVDNDKHAEVIVLGHNLTNHDAIRVYGAANNDWVNARGVWNQPSYHVTNVNDDGSMPKHEAPSWLLNNTYRCQAPIGAIEKTYSAANLTASYLRADGSDDEWTLTIRIGNAGAKAAPAGVPVHFYSGPANSGTLIGMAYTNRSLEPGEYQDVSYYWGNVSFAQVHLKAVVNEDHAIAECQENDNSVETDIMISSALPDLVVLSEDVTLAPSNPASGEHVTVSAKISNYGAADAQGVHVEIYDGDPVSGGILLSQSFLTLAAGHSQTITADWGILDGGHTLFVMVDRGNSIIETDETNNRVVRKVMTDMKDIALSVDDLVFLPEHPVSGDAVALSIIARNPGIRETGPFTLNLYDGPPQAGGNLLNSFSIDNIAAAGSKTVFYNFTAQAGVYWFYAVADSANLVVELDENNNSASCSLIVKDQGQTYGPDLVPLRIETKNMVTDPQTLQSAGSVAVTFQNRGDEKIETPFTISVFEDLNRDQIYTPGVDIFLGQVQNTRLLMPNGAFGVDVPITGKVAFLHPPLAAVLDGSDAVLEQNEENNIILSGEDCENRPVKSITVTTKWTWRQPVVYPAYEMHGPLVVANLTDDNGDGVVNSKDIPEIIAANDRGYLTVLRGDTGELLFENKVDQLGYYPFISVADIDNDGLPEIIAKKNDEATLGFGLLAFKNDGTLIWDNSDLIKQWNNSGKPAGQWINLNLSLRSIADIDLDGQPDIIAGNCVFNNDGSVKWVAIPPDQTSGRGILVGNWGLSSIVVDLNLDGVPEILAGNTAYKNDGSVYWHHPALVAQGVTDGVTAIGNLDDDPYPEIALVTFYKATGLPPNGRLYVLEHDGTVKWGPICLENLPGVKYVGGVGGVPIIADFEGDGEPEVGFKGYDYYFVFDKNGNLKNKLYIPYQADGGYSAPAVFDLNGDDRPEVLINSDRFFRIFDGKTAELLFEEPFGACFNTYQNVIISDLDGDHHAEAAVLGWDYVKGGNTIRVYESANQDWVNARGVWNQPGYHITNINDDNSIPRHEAPSWLLNNTYRCQAPLDTVESNYASANLTASYLRISRDEERLFFTVRIGNGGAKAVPALVPVAFYNGAPNSGALIGSTQTTRPLKPGEYQDLTMRWDASLIGVLHFAVVVNPNNAIPECKVDDNVVETDYQMPLKYPDLKTGAEDINLPDMPVAEGDVVTIPAFIHNIGSEPAADIKVQLFLGDPDAGGIQIGESQTCAILASGTTEVLTFAFDSMGHGGTNMFHLVVDKDNLIQEENETNNRAVFSLEVGEPTLPNLMITAADIAYTPSSIHEGEQVTIKVEVHNRGAATQMIPVRVYTGDPDAGGVMIEEQTIYDFLGLGQSATLNVLFSTTGLNGSRQIYVRADPLNVISESNETDNQAYAELVIQPVGLSTTMSMNKTAYQAEEDAVITLDMSESLGLLHQLLCDLSIQDDKGNKIALISQKEPVEVLGNASVQLVKTWNAAYTLAGEYRAVAEFYENGLKVSQVITNFSIEPDLAVKGVITADKMEYKAQQTVVLSNVVTNLSKNQIWENLIAQVQILAPDQTELYASTKNVPLLMPGARFSFADIWSTGANPAGTYAAILKVSAGQTLVSESRVEFRINASSDTGQGLIGTIAVTPAAVIQGADETFAYSVTNKGNMDLDDLFVRIVIADPVNGQVIQTLQDVASVPMNTTLPGNKVLNTSGLAVGQYLAILQVYKDTFGAPKSLASVVFEVRDGAAPVVNILSPLNGSIQVGPFNMSVTAVDDASGVDYVEYQVDGGAWQRLALINPALNEYSRVWTPVSADQGAHSIAFRAADKAGNVSQPVLTSFSIDLVTPFEKLSGTLQAAPNPVDLGQDVSFQYSIHNETDQALNNLSVKILVTDPDTQEIKITLSETIDLTAETVHTGTLKTSTSGLAIKTYETALKVETAGEEPRRLAGTVFTVKAAQELEAEKTIADETRLLVWVNDYCPSSCRIKEHEITESHHDDPQAETSCNAWLRNEISEKEPLRNKIQCQPNSCHECLDLNLLKVVLEQVADHYKIVFSPCAFADELRNPFYTDILVLGDHHSLPDHIAAELREKVHGGTGLISSQWLKRGCSAAYDEVFGITYKGQLSASNPLIETVQSPITEPGTFRATGRTYRIKTDPDTITAAWVKTHGKWKAREAENTVMCPNPQNPDAALVLHNYGRGRTIYHAFDLGRSLQEENKAWVKLLLKNSLGYIHQTSDAQIFAPYTLVPVNLGLKNLGVELTVRISETFPKELGLYDPVAKQWIDEIPWVFDTGLGAGEEKNIRFYYLTPDEAGTYQTQTDISLIVNDEPVPDKQLKLDLTVAKNTDTILAETVDALRALSLPSHDQARVKHALALLDKIKTKTIRTQHDLGEIIGDLLRTIDFLRSVKSVDLTEYRLTLDRLIKIHGSMHYLFIPPGDHLTGVVEAVPNPVKGGEEVNFHVTVANNGNETFADLKLKVVIMDPGTHKVIKVLPQSLILEGGTSREFDLKALLRNFKPKTYKVLLKAYAGLLPEPKVLAELDLEVLAR